MARKVLKKRISLKVHSDLYKQLTDLAAWEGRSLNNLIIKLLQESLTHRDLWVVGEPPRPPATKK